MRVDAPSGATSLRRTAIERLGPVGRDLELDDRARPGSRAAPSSGSLSKQSRAPVLHALVGGQSGRITIGAPVAAVAPAVAGRGGSAQRSGLRSRQPGVRRRAPAERTLDARRAASRLGDPAARPLPLGRAGGTLSCIQTRSIGSAMMPVSTPFSQWSHQRTQLLEEADRPARADRDADICATQGPIRPFAGHVQRGEQRGTPRWCSRRPSRRRQDRAGDRAVVLADRAVLPVVVATLVAQPLAPASGRCLRAAPATSPASPRRRRRVRRAGVVGEHASTPSDRLSVSRQPPM